MAQRNGGPRQAVKWLAWVLVSVAAAALCWYHGAPSSVRAVASTKALDATQGTPFTQHVLRRVDLSLPASLAGSTPPHLPLDSLGRLARTHAVREFFDYFLTARRELTPTAMDRLVCEAIALQLGHSAAADEAVMVWRHYNVYLDTLAQMPAPPAPVPGSAIDYESVFALLDQRAALGDRIMGEWSPPFFADELQRERITLERQRIIGNTALTAAEKTERLNDLDQRMPAQDRAMRQHIDQQQSQVDTLMDIESQNLSADATRAQINQAFGPEVADRAMALRQPDDAWQAEYNDYAVERSQLQQQNITPDQYSVQVAQLRQRYFSNPSEIARAASFDRVLQP